jgi:hypothetical protein
LEEDSEHEVMDEIFLRADADDCGYFAFAVLHLAGQGRRTRARPKVLSVISDDLSSRITPAGYWQH